MSIWVLLWCLLYKLNMLKKMASVICVSFINFRFNVCVLATIIIGDKLVYVHPDISKIFFRFMSENKFTQICAAKYQTYLEKQLNNFWTWNNSMLMKYHTGDSAE